MRVPRFDLFVMHMVNRVQFFVECWFSDEEKWFDYRTTDERFPLTLLAVCSGTFWWMIGGNHRYSEAESILNQHGRGSNERFNAPELESTRR